MPIEESIQVLKEAITGWEQYADGCVFKNGKYIDDLQAYFNDILIKADLINEREKANE